MPCVGRCRSWPNHADPEAVSRIGCARAMKEFRRFRLESGPDEHFTAIATCRRARRLLAVPSNGPLQLFDLGDGSRIWSRDCGSLTGMQPRPGLLAPSFSTDGDTIVAVSSGDEVLFLIDTGTGDVIRRLQLPGVAGNDCHAVRIDPSARFALLSGCAGTACFSLHDGEMIWSEFGREESCSDSLHVTRAGDVVFSVGDGFIQVRSVERGALRMRFPGTKNFVVGEDELQLVCYEHMQGFTRVSLATGELLGRFAFEPAVKLGPFAWSSRQSLIVAADESASTERLVVIDLQADEVIDTTPLPVDEECWHVAFSPQCDDGVLVVGDACVVYEYRL